jgi:hypothetical protein
MRKGGIVALTNMYNATVPCMDIGLINGEDVKKIY